MIHIRKQNAPKKMVEQVAALKAEDGWKSAADTDTEKLRSYFDQLDKTTIRNALYEEQHGLCAYCMRRIHNDESMVIEHWQPVKKNENDTQWKKDNALAYSNMLGCCDGGKKSDDTRKVLSCDAAKSNEQIIISPWKKEHIEKIVYRANGRIATNPYDAELEHDINYVLHLNGKLDENGNIVHDTSTALLCSDFCQAPIFYFAKRHFEKTLDNIVSGIATLLYVDWLPQCNGFAVSATI